MSDVNPSPPTSGSPKKRKRSPESAAARRARAQRQGERIAREIKTLTYRRGSFGAGYTFVPALQIFEEFNGTGISERAFFLWLRSLGVPILHIGRERLIRLQTLKLALSAITQVGSKDFRCPSYLGPSANFGWTESLDPASVKAHYRELLMELVFTQAVAGRTITKEVVTELEEEISAFARLMLSKVPKEAALKQQRELMKNASTLIDAKGLSSYVDPPLNPPPPDSTNPPDPTEDDDPRSP